MFSCLAAEGHSVGDVLPLPVDVKVVGDGAGDSIKMAPLLSSHVILFRGRKETWTNSRNGMVSISI